jgi:outer membrane immunogenic protein
MKSKIQLALIGSAVILVMPFTYASAAESGFYLGGSIGSAAVEANIDGGVGLPDPAPVFDEDDFGWKVFAGYNFALAEVFTLGLEGGYTDLGKPSADVLSIPVSVNPTALNMYGTVGFDIGPVGVFAKYGVVNWDVEAVIDDIRVSDDGSDPAYGIGLRFNLGSVEIRGEYEIFDVSDVEDVTMLSVGLAYRF